MLCLYYCMYLQSLVCHELREIWNQSCKVTHTHKQAHKPITVHFRGSAHRCIIIQTSWLGTFRYLLEPIPLPSAHSSCDFEPIRVNEIFRRLSICSCFTLNSLCICSVQSLFCCLLELTAKCWLYWLQQMYVTCTCTPKQETECYHSHCRFICTNLMSSHFFVPVAIETTGVFGAHTLAYCHFHSRHLSKITERYCLIIFLLFVYCFV